MLNDKWKKEEIQTLKREYPEKGSKIATKLNKSVQSVYNKAYKLGIKTQAYSKSRKWTDEEKEKLRRNYKEKGSSLAEELNRTPGSILQMANKMNLRYKVGYGRIKHISDSARKLTPEKGYVLGVVGPGDGHVGYQVLSLGATDLEFVKYFGSCLEDVYESYVSKGCYIYEGIKPMFYATLSSKEAYEDILRYGPIEHFREKQERVPKAVKVASPDIKSHYLKAFFDSQGNVGIDSYQVNAFKSNKYLLNEVKDILSDLGISSRLYKVGHTRKVTILGEHNLKRFKKKIGFIIKRKTSSLDELLSSYKYSCWAEDETEFLCRNYRSNPKQIAKRLNRSVKSVVGKVWELGLTKSRR